MRITVSFDFDRHKAERLLPLGFDSLFGKTKGMTDEQLILKACEAARLYGLSNAKIEDGMTYEIVHLYDEDSGFGDSVGQEEVIGHTKDKEKAEEYVRRYNRPEVYDHPYDWLWCHELEIREIDGSEDLDLDKDPWKDDWYSRETKLVKECYGDKVPVRNWG